MQPGHCHYKIRKSRTYRETSCKYQERTTHQVCKIENGMAGIFLRQAAPVVEKNQLFFHLEAGLHR